MVKENKIWYRSKDSLFNIKTLNIKKRQAQQLTLYNFDKIGSHSTDYHDRLLLTLSSGH